MPYAVISDFAGGVPAAERAYNSAALAGDEGLSIPEAKTLAQQAVYGVRRNTSDKASRLRKYQAVALVAVTGKWDADTRKAAAEDMGVPISQLPPVGYVPTAGTATGTETGTTTGAGATGTTGTELAPPLPEVAVPWFVEYRYYLVALLAAGVLVTAALVLRKRPIPALALTTAGW